MTSLDRWGVPSRESDPEEQPFYQRVGDAWVDVPTQSQTESSSSGPGPAPFRVKLITWNIDALAQCAVIRMKSALDYLEDLVSSLDTDVPVVIFFQEMLPSDLNLIRAAGWIQNRFFLTDLSGDYWETRYGTTTLVDRRLEVRKVFRVHMVSGMGRDGLFVDLAIPTAPTPTPTAGDADVTADVTATATLRLCNTHLESLVADPPIRPAQVKLAAQHMHKAYASVLAGDCNAIQPFDRTLHSENGLKDAYLELGGQEDTEEGYTWGQMSPAFLRERFGCSRMDKIMYAGNMRVEAFEQIGKGVMVKEEHRAQMKRYGMLPFVTDHYGLMVDIIIDQTSES